MPSNQPATLDSLSTTTESKPDRLRLRLPAWLLPVGLLLGFILVFALLFGGRLIPAVPVRVAPIVTIRNENPTEVVENLTTTSPTIPNKTLLFQASGWIEPDPFIISVSTLVSGIVEEVYVLEGETVKKDQPLARLIDEDAKLDLEACAARAATLAAEVTANQSRIPMVQSKRVGFENNIKSETSKLDEMIDKLDRLKSLPRGSIPAIDLAAAELQVEQQKSRVAQAASEISGIESELEMINAETIAKESAFREAEVAVKIAQLALDRHLIKSPMDGTILHLHAAPGHKRMIEMDDPKSGYIVELFDPEKLQSRIDVPLSEAAALSVGQPVEITTDLLNNVILKGVVTRITGEADLQRNTLQVKVSINNPDSRLRPEMLVRAKFFPITKSQSTQSNITTRRIPGARFALYVPEAAIVGGDQLWVVDPEGKAELRRISLGTDTRDSHQLALGGMKSGEKVILPPHTKLKPGVTVKIIP